MNQHFTEDLAMGLRRVLQSRIHGRQLLQGGVPGFLRDVAQSTGEAGAERIAQSSFHDYWRNLVPNSPYIKPAEPLPKWLG